MFYSVNTKCISDLKVMDSLTSYHLRQMTKDNFLREGSENFHFLEIIAMVMAKNNHRHIRQIPPKPDSVFVSPLNSRDGILSANHRSLRCVRNHHLRLRCRNFTFAVNNKRMVIHFRKICSGGDNRASEFRISLSSS